MRSLPHARRKAGVAREIVPEALGPWGEADATVGGGEIGDAHKGAFLGGADAVLFPIDWPEPFGLVMFEAMACGTPTVAYCMGSVPEVFDDGATGYVVHDIDGAVRALERIPAIDRRRCREVFEERFSVARMARSYVALYERVAALHWSRRRSAAKSSGAGRLQPHPPSELRRGTTHGSLAHVADRGVEADRPATVSTSSE